MNHSVPKFVPYKNHEAFLAFGNAAKEKYLSSDPFPNAHFENFFNADIADGILDEFPDLQKIADYQFRNTNEQKLATKGEYKLGDRAVEFIHFLNSQPFLDFLSALTGIDHLIPDPTLIGGGYHEIKPNGYLKIHSDFNKHPAYGLDRRLNVLIYLNKDWKEEYGGHFELWDKEMKYCVRKIAPLFNTMAIFSTTSTSYHGHPNPLTCPPDRSRKSIALYYYTNGRPQEEIDEQLEKHSTVFKARDGIDDKATTESYLIKKIRQEKRKSRTALLARLGEAITPPIIWNSARKLLSK